MDDQVLEMVAGRFKVLAEPTRLKILRVLKDRGELHVSQLMDFTGMGQANLSKHLGILAGAGMVSRRKSGLKVYYKISDPTIFTLCDMMCRTMEETLHSTMHRLKRNPS